MAQQRYWVVGGEYRDTNFAELIDGTQRLAGPFGEYKQALAHWRQMIGDTGGDACQRYTIAEEHKFGLAR